MKALAEIKNAPQNTDGKYIVARLVGNELWYWGAWDDKDAAESVAETFENGIVLERGW